MATPLEVVASRNLFVHPTAEISPKAVLGNGVKVWNHAQIREGARIGDNCIIGKSVYVDFDVCLGPNCKVQNGAYLYHGANVEEGVFIGPRVCLTNDRLPRAITPDGRLKEATDWKVGPITICYGASLGTGVIVVPGVTIGRFALVAAGAVVTSDVPDHGLVMGVPAHLVGYVCCLGTRLEQHDGCFSCSGCGWTVENNRLAGK